MPFKGSLGGKPSKSFRSVLRVFNSFSDSFERSDNSGLIGLSTSRGFWTSLRGKWITSGGAISPDNTAGYPIISLEMSTPNITASISSDIYNQNRGLTATVSNMGAGNGTTGSSGYYWATLSGLTTTSGMAVGDYISATPGTGRIYDGFPDLVEITQIIDSTSINFRVKGGTPPANGSVANVIWSKNQSAGAGLAVWTTDSNNWIGIVNGIGIDSSCNCSLCGNGTYTCTGYTSSSSCSTTSQYCSSGGCNRYSSYTTPNYGRAVTGFYRVFSYTRTEFCSGWASGTCSYSCTGWSSSTSCSTSTQNVSSCNCQTCYPSYISVIKSTAGAISELARYSLNATAKAIKIITNSTSKTLTIKPYKDQAMSNQIGSDLSYNNNALSSTNKFGIVLAPSEQKQGSNIKDFKIDAN